ncbi:MAG: hypothetical protein ACOVP4_01095 [Bacteriovoracaceae bacterium]
MKFFRSLSLMMIIGLTLPAMAQGSGVGNGGYSVVCRNPTTKQITSAELLDVFEGRNLHYLEYSNNPVLKSEDFINFSLNYLETVNKNFRDAVSDEVKKLEAKIIYIPENLVLEPTNDAFPTLGRKDCKFEQLATYTDDNKLYVSKEIYSALDELNKAALRLHEAIYIIARKADQKDSKATRVIVSGSLALAPSNAELIVSKVNEMAVVVTQNLPAPRLTCGETGTLERRIIDCNKKVVTKSGHEWTQVQKNLEKKYSWGDEIIIYHSEIYKAPNGVLATVLTFDLKTSQGRGKRKVNAKKIIEELKANNFCNNTSAYGYFSGYPSSASHLSLNMRLANFSEISELLEKFEGSSVFPFENGKFVMSDETFKETNDSSYEYFFKKKKFMSEYYKAPMTKSLKTYNPISHRIANNNVSAENLKVLCIE